KGKMAGGEPQIVFGGEGGGLRDGAPENGFGFGELAKMDERVGAVGDQGRVVRIEGSQRGVERSSLVELIVAAVETGQHPGEIRVGRVGRMQLFDDRNRFAGLLPR